MKAFLLSVLKASKHEVRVQNSPLNFDRISGRVDMFTVLQGTNPCTAQDVGGWTP